jgi:hypothetical protein
MTKKPNAKTAAITLKANGSTLMLLATLRPDGTVKTCATTRDADKKVHRGMTSVHPSMDAAKAHLADLADKATKLGWQRGARVHAAAPDAFSKLPAPPKAA